MFLELSGQRIIIIYKKVFGFAEESDQAPAFARHSCRGMSGIWEGDLRSFVDDARVRQVCIFIFM